MTALRGRTRDLGVVAAAGTGVWLASAVQGLAQDAPTAPTFDGGISAWLIVATALVLFMTPGLALFYGGLVRRKNVLSTFMHSFAAIGIVTIVWVVVGYSIAFGPSIGGWIGDPMAHFMLAGTVGEMGPVSGAFAAGAPLLLWVMYQAMFAVITPALISGAYAERITFKGYAVFTALWSLLVYAPLAHWVWNPEGWLFKLGALDFAGGTVVHIASGVAALMAAIVIGPRKGFKHDSFMPHNLPLAILGAGILWFGWFGFNAGGAVNSGGAPAGAAYAGVSEWSVAATAFSTTHISAAVAMIVWLLLELISHGKATTLGAATGLVAGLVAITPAAGFVTTTSAIIIGAAVAVVCFYGIRLKTKLGYDDALDAVGVHGIGGIVGAIATGLFSVQYLNGWGADGLLAGNPSLLVNQLIAVGATLAFSGVASFILLKLTDMIVGLRVDAESEIQGLDMTEHSEQGYTSM